MTMLMIKALLIIMITIIKISLTNDDEYDDNNDPLLYNDNGDVCNSDDNINDPTICDSTHPFLTLSALWKQGITVKIIIV